MRKYLPGGLIISVRTFVLLVFSIAALAITIQLSSLDIEDQAVYSYCVMNVVYVFCGTFFLVGSLVTSLWCDLRWDD